MLFKKKALKFVIIQVNQSPASSLAVQTILATKNSHDTLSRNFFVAKILGAAVKSKVWPFAFNCSYSVRFGTQTKIFTIIPIL